MTSPSGDHAISSANKDTYFDASDDGGSYTPDSGVDVLSQMDPISRAKAEEDLKAELIKTEEEIMTLRQVLSAKLRHQQMLKNKLGITVWTEFREDMQQGIRTIQESAAFQKTSQTLKTAGDKTSEAFGALGTTVSKKLGEVKNMPAFKTMEEKVSSAYSNVKTRVGSRDESSLLEHSTEDTAVKSPSK